MWFEQIIRKETGCATYLIGSAETGECAVFDPLWDVQPYADAAKKHASKVRYIIDSHCHADHISGARRLAKMTGGQVMMPEQAGVDFEATPIKGADKIQMGEVTLEVVATPGHRPEHICLLVTDLSRGDQPWCILTADFLMVGDIARPDLAQGGEEGAQTIFDVALPAVANLPDFVEIYPGHVAGST
ncbi:MAG: MBL fold metallo-hydrolase [Chloroflexota bacterium]